MANIHYGEVKNRHLDQLLAVRHVSALDLVTWAASPTTAGGNLVANWSVGSPTLAQIPGSRQSALSFRGSTITVDYQWRVPSEVDNRHPIYIRPHWAVSTIGTTLSVTWQAWYATITDASTLVTSPTTVLDTVIGSDSNGSSTVQYVLNTGPRGSIRPLATGVNAFQTTGDAVEFIHFAIQPSTTTNITLGTNLLYLVGFDLEYTRRMLWGGPSGKEGRKLETNLGWQEMGAANQY